MQDKIAYQPEQFAEANGLSIVYDAFGEKDAPVILLIMGLGTQMIAWPESFCRLLAAAGFRVIRFDNRDIGLSSKIEVQPPWLVGLWLRYQVGMLGTQVPYSLQDMAKDTFALMDTLDVKQAHVVGASMGGMIAQIMAIESPERVLSLTSMISTTGRKGLPGPNLNVVYRLWRQSESDESNIIKRLCDIRKAIGSPAYPLDDEESRQQVEVAFHRNYSQDGYKRQLAALLTAKSRVSRLQHLSVPTLVIHGESDPLVPVAAGWDTAHCIPGATLKLFEGMGHELPEPLLPEFARLITQHAQQYG